MLAETLIGARAVASGAGSDTTDLQLQRALRIARRHLKMDFGFISQFANGRRYFRYIDTDLPACPISVGGSDPLEESYCQRVVDGRLPELIPDACLNAEALTLPATRALPVGGHISVPLQMQNGSVYGTLCCFSYAPDLTLNERDLDMLRAFGAVVAEMIGESVQHRALLDETRQRVQTIEEQLRQAVKMEAVGQLTGGIAHDFNNLLAIVIGNLDSVVDDPALSHDLKLCVEGALDGALRGADLTRRLLNFSRKQPLKSDTVNLNAVIENLAGILGRALGGNILFEMEPAADLWPSRIDAGQLDEAILNMAVNARDAMPGGGVLKIRTENVHLDHAFVAANPGSYSGDHVLLTISDTGTGMSPEIVARCLEPFFTTKDVGKGTGLGLSMVYGFVKQSGGTITIDSVEGRGTSIKIYLPRAIACEPVVASRSDEKRIPMGSGQTVLVVDDNAELRETVIRQLVGLGYQTLEAENAAAALQILETNGTVDLLFSDIVMPGGITGVELAKRACAMRSGLKILLTSGNAAQAMADAGATFSLLNKPYRREEFARHIREALES